MSIGGSIFIHNAIEFDYCLAEAIGSLVGFCDEIVVLDASSTDNTLDLLKEIQRKYPFTLIEAVPWDIAEDKHRLVVLANMAKNALKTDWHFMLQADEVIHECSYDSIREFVTHPEYDSALMRRYNLWGDFNTYIKFDSKCMPCSTEIVRLGKIQLDAYGDAESLMGGCEQIDKVKDIIIFHYGMLRKNMLEKVIAMQKWFWGKNGLPDARYVKMKETGGIFKPYEIISESELAVLPISHPAIMDRWIEERTNEHKNC